MGVDVVAVGAQRHIDAVLLAAFGAAVGQGGLELSVKHVALYLVTLIIGVMCTWRKAAMVKSTTHST